MVQVKSLQSEMTNAAIDVLRDSQVLSPAELVKQLADIEERKQRLMGLLKICNSYMAGQIDDPQYQMLVDYTLMQAAKKNINSDELFLELKFKYAVEDLRELKIRQFWEALTFVRAYVEEEI